MCIQQIDCYSAYIANKQRGTTVSPGHTVESTNAKCTVKTESTRFVKDYLRAEEGDVACVLVKLSARVEHDFIVFGEYKQCEPCPQETHSAKLGSTDEGGT
uniref:Cystatin domain-containing protein n=1 Tax=Steinernema glaseri TaxID=37863 RepID=A0A1I7YFY9_9BILA